jgi:nucleotide-binding universal stress UspA family protein
MYSKILVAYDGSGGAKAALNKALQISAKRDSNIVMAWVCDRLPTNPLTIGEVNDDINDLEAHFSVLRKEAEELAAQDGIKIQSVCLKGPVAPAIAKYSKKTNVDLVCIGKSGHRGKLRKFKSSKTDKIKMLVKCECFIAEEIRK